MDWFAAHWPDLLAVMVILACTAYGYKRGIVRMVIFLAGFAAAAVFAAFVSGVCSEYVYMRLIRPAVISALEKNIAETKEKYDPEERIKELLAEKNITLSPEEEAAVFGENGEDELSLLTEKEFCGTLNNVFTEYCAELTGSLSGVLPDEIAGKAAEYIAESGSGTREKLDFLRSPENSATEITEQEIVRPVMLRTVKNVLFAVTFLFVTALAALLANAFGILRKISLIKAADTFLGGLLGFIYGLMITAALALLFAAAIRLSGGSLTYLNNDIISGTYFFRFICYAAFLMISIIF